MKNLTPLQIAKRATQVHILSFCGFSMEVIGTDVSEMVLELINNNCASLFEQKGITSPTPTQAAAAELAIARVIAKKLPQSVKITA